MTTGLPLFDTAPYVRGSSTSRAAAESISSRITPLQQKVMDYLREHGPATDEQMQAGIPLGANTQRPRRVELWRKGAIKDTGSKRTNASGKQAVVWGLAR